MYVMKVNNKLLNFIIYRLLGFSGGSVVKNPCANAGDAGSIPGSARSPGEGNGNHSSILAWKSHGQGSLVGYSPWGRKELDMTEQLNFHCQFQCHFHALLGP